MSSASINIQTDDELKYKAQLIFADLGIDMSTAVNAFLSQVVYWKGIPFEISKPIAKQARLGGWEGLIKTSEDFDEPMEEFADYMI